MSHSNSIALARLTETSRRPARRSSRASRARYNSASHTRDSGPSRTPRPPTITPVRSSPLRLTTRSGYARSNHLSTSTSSSSTSLGRGHVRLMMAFAPDQVVAHQGNLTGGARIDSARAQRMRKSHRFGQGQHVEAVDDIGPARSLRLSRSATYLEQLTNRGRGCPVPRARRRQLHLRGRGGIPWPPSAGGPGEGGSEGKASASPDSEIRAGAPASAPSITSRRSAAASRSGGGRSNQANWAGSTVPQACKASTVALSQRGGFRAARTPDGRSGRAPTRGGYNDRVPFVPRDRLVGPPRLD